MQTTKQMIPSKEQIVRKRTKRMPDWETDPEVVACEAHRDSSKKVMTWERHPKKGPTKFHKKLQVLQSSGWDWGERLYISIMLLSWESDQNGRAVTRRQRAQNGVTYVKTHQDLRPGLAAALASGNATFNTPTGSFLVSTKSLSADGPSEGGPCPKQCVLC